jgi:Asp/Glu/hydantoin racemase
MSKILVINPNSNPDVTAGMRNACLALIEGFWGDIEFTTLARGPFGIESDAHILEVIPLIEEVIANSDADAFVIGCYSDPGLRETRAKDKRPIFGLQRSAILTALQQADNFGVLALSDVSIRRHLAYIERMGFSDFLAGELPINLSVAEGEKPEAFDVLERVGQQLVAQTKAQSVVLGCAGLARHKNKLAQKLGVAVIDPVQAAVAHAVSAVSAAS